MSYCLIASLHAARDLARGGDCGCEHCTRECYCDEPKESAGGALSTDERAA